MDAISRATIHCAMWLARVEIPKLASFHVGDHWHSVDAPCREQHEIIRDDWNVDA